MRHDEDMKNVNVNERYLPEGYRIGTPENRAYISSISGLERAMATGAVCEAPAVMCDSGDFSLKIDLGCAVGVIRREEAALVGAGEEIKNIAVLTRVGRAVAFTVQYIDKTATPPIAYLSRKEAQRRCMREYIADLVPGDIVPAKVTHLERFGAFIDVGCGIISMLPLDAISVSRISHPRERFSVSSRIYVVIKSIEGTGRINVSHRELLGTWEENAAQFSAGQTVAGTIRSVESYGIFVELTPNLTGLSEPNPDITAEMLRCDGIRTAAVYIKSISPEKMKIKLSVVGAYRGELLRDASAPRYFIDPRRVSHIDRWRYSPPESVRIVETVF